MVIQIPTPATHGYIHLGDAFVILSGVILGKKYGSLAAGIGSAFADIFSGYAYYAPTTFVVLYKALISHGVKELIAMIPCGLADILFVVAGYFLHSYITEGIGPALLSVPSNAIQGCSGLIVAAILLPILTAVPDIKKAKLCMNHE